MLKIDYGEICNSICSVSIIYAAAFREGDDVNAARFHGTLGFLGEAAGRVGICAFFAERAASGSQKLEGLFFIFKQAKNSLVQLFMLDSAFVHAFNIKGIL